MNHRETWTLDDTLRSNNPGQVQVEYLRWFLHYPAWPLGWMLGLALSIVLAIVVHWAFWLLAVLVMLPLNVLYWLRVRDHFMNGDTVPAVVISLDPLLIAAGPDMTKGHGSYPAIKIMKLPLKTIMGRLPQIGDTLPTVALYNTDPENKPYWVDVHPRPVEAGTSNLQIVQWKLMSIPRHEWDRLYTSLRQVPLPYRCGLYFTPGGIGQRQFW